MSAITLTDLGVYKESAERQSVALARALAWAGAMAKKRSRSPGRPKKTSPKHMQKMISGPEETIQKGMARAKLLGMDFSPYVMRLIELDYARDERVIMTVAEETPEYRKFRKEYPPMPLQKPEETGSQPEGAG